MAQGAMSAVLVTAQPCDTPVTAALSPGRHTQLHWLELWPAQHMDPFQISHHAAPTSPPSLKTLPPDTSITSPHRDGVGCVGAHRDLAQLWKKGIALGELVLPQELPTLRAGDHGQTAGGGGQNIVVKAETQITRKKI